MIRTVRISILLGLVVFIAPVGKVLAGTITTGNLVVVRVGTGTGALAAPATASFLDEFTTAGAPVQSIALPTTVAASGNRALTLTGNSTSEGFLKQSTNTQYLALGGYNVAVGGTTATGTLSAANRVVGVVNIATGGVDTTTALTDAYDGSNIRSAFTTDGTNIWTGGNAGSGLGATGGIRYATLGGTTSVRTNDGTNGGSNSRTVQVYNGQLYDSASSSPRLAVQQIGTGTPTTGGQAETTLTGMPTSGTHSTYDFWFANPNTVYLADDGGVGSGGGIQKWTLSGGTWSLTYTLLNNGTTTTAVRGLTGYVNGSGNAVLFGTTGNLLLTVTDTGAGATSTTLATAAANTAYRGVAYINDIPEPASAMLLLLAGIPMLVFRCRSPK